MAAFTVGALLPLLAIVLPPPALAGAGHRGGGRARAGLHRLVSARLGSSDARRATVRVVIGGLLAMAVTYGIGALVGTQLG